MWPRVAEFMLACWLAISPFVFRYSAEQTANWSIDVGAGAAVMAFSAAAHHRRLRYAHVGTLAVSLALAAWSYVRANAAWPVPPAEQNHLLVALLLLMFAVIPTNCNEPPPAWRAAFAFGETSAK